MLIQKCFEVRRDNLMSGCLIPRAEISGSFISLMFCLPKGPTALVRETAATGLRHRLC
jgi:hypothetical protein